MVEVGPIKEKHNFKANEFFNYFQFGIQLLLESNIKPKSEQLLDSFSKNAAGIFDSPKCETLNMHSLCHLVHQVRRFGPLFVSSAVFRTSEQFPQTVSIWKSFVGGI